MMILQVYWGEWSKNEIIKDPLYYEDSALNQTQGEKETIQTKKLIFLIPWVEKSISYCICPEISKESVYSQLRQDVRYIIK